jgi:23S rRNA U2552 (ribose-2'-O)-methylase RlmE/FtsJ
MSWNEVYSEIIDFYFWEPQHIGRKKCQDSKYNGIKAVLSHINQMEVSLNHQLLFFFSLLPKNVIKKLFKKSFNCNLSDEFALNGKMVEEILCSIKDMTQPDFVFFGEKNIVYIEMKTDSKSDLEQVFKYSLFHLIIEDMMKKKLQPNLLFLGKGDFKNIWREHYENSSELINALLKYQPPVITKKGKFNVADFNSRLIELYHNIRVNFMNYQQFCDFLSNENMNTGDDEVLKKLISGMNAELKKRKLAN